MDPRKVFEQLLIHYQTHLQIIAKSEGVTLNQEEQALQALSLWGVSEARKQFQQEALFHLFWPEQEVGIFTIQPSANGLQIRVLIVSRIAYESWSDPFRWNEFFPAVWTTLGQLPRYTWDERIVQQRDVLHLERILKEGDSPLLLGAVQAVVDGGNVLLTAEDGPPEIVQQLWALLPESNRAEVTCCTLAVQHDLRFNIAYRTEVSEPWPEPYYRAKECRNYPEGAYEKALQIAVESRDQAELSRLLNRRSSKQSLRLALLLALVLVVATLFTRWIL